MSENIIEELSDDPFEATLREMQGGSSNTAEVENRRQQLISNAQNTTVSPNENKGERNFKILLDIEVTLTMEIGRSLMALSDLLLLGQGSVIELDRLVGEDLDILIGDKKIATAEVMISQEKFGAKMKAVVSHKTRLDSLKEL